MGEWIKKNENRLYELVENGQLQIDSEGRIWRVKCKYGLRYSGGFQVLPCDPRRAEQPNGLGYLVVGAIFNQQKFSVGAHRLVFRHFFGEVPDGLIVNHKNGIGADNWPGNLEAMTQSANILHSLYVLGLGKGPKPSLQKVTDEQVREIRRRRGNDESAAKLAAEFGVTRQSIWDIAGKRARGDVIDLRDQSKE